MVMRLAVLGTSEGNGHPYSFSAIINGYDTERMRAAGWPGIADYLDERDPVDLGFRGVQVTHAWCPDPAETRRLCAATGIPQPVAAPEDLISEVDGVVIARDDWRTHGELAAPFLAAGVPVFVDKPLTLDRAVLEAFRPHLEAGGLMSCSGFRFAPELDEPLTRRAAGERALVSQAVGPKDWDRYAVHLVEPLLRLHRAPPTAITWIPASHDVAVIEFADGSTAAIHCLGERPTGFRLDVTTSERAVSLQLRDRFTAFRRLLAHFIEMVDSGRPPFDPAETVSVMHLLAAGVAAGSQHQRVPIAPI